MQHLIRYYYDGVSSLISVTSSPLIVVLFVTPDLCREKSFLFLSPYISTLTLTYLNRVPSGLLENNSLQENLTSSAADTSLHTLCYST